MGGTPVIENPGSSMIWLHTRFQWLLEALEVANMKDPRSVLRLPHNNLMICFLGSTTSVPRFQEFVKVANKSLTGWLLKVFLESNGPSLEHILFICFPYCLSQLRCTRHGSGCAISNHRRWNEPFFGALGLLFVPFYPLPTCNVKISTSKGKRQKNTWTHVERLLIKEQAF